MHQIANVLDKLPKSIQPRAKQALHAMMYAESRAECEREMGTFVEEYRAKYPKAAASLVENSDRLLTFLLPLVRAGVRFVDGRRVERNDKTGVRNTTRRFVA